jgi:hypothetical protein
MSNERPIRLHAGPWSLEFERWSGWVRCIRLGGVEVIRAVYAAVRGADWATFSQRVVTSHVAQEEGRFEATWAIEVDELAFRWSGRVWSDGTVCQLEWTGESDETFESRRTGMCVLHPMELRGIECEVEHTDRAVEQGSFPILIEPDQPFFDIRKVAYPAGSARFQAEFSGEVFEMEDQRNWTDASFKTYCRPQEWPQPFQVVEGSRLEHRLSMTFQGVPAQWEPSCRTRLTVGERTFPLPRLGTVANGQVDGFSYVLDPEDTADWTPAGFGRLYSVSGQFVELNRNRPDMAEWDGVAYEASPQVHTVDERSIMENVLGLGDTVVTARGISGGKPVCVGPIRFRRAKQGGRDSRLDEGIASAWFLASLLVLAESGADAVCFLEKDDFSGRLRNALELVSGVSSITPLLSENPYRAMGFQIGGRTVLINMRPYATSVHFESDIELEPYQILLID